MPFNRTLGAAFGGLSRHRPTKRGGGHALFALTPIRRWWRWTRLTALLFEKGSGVHTPLTNGPITYELDGTRDVVVGAWDTLYAFAIR